MLTRARVVGLVKALFGLTPGSASLLLESGATAKLSALPAATPAAADLGYLVQGGASSQAPIWQLVVGGLVAPAAAAGAGAVARWKGQDAGSGNSAGGSLVAEPGLKAGGGADGVFVVRQPGGAAGTKEAQLYHNGTDMLLDVKSGSLFVNAASGRVGFTTGAGGGGNEVFRVDLSNGGARFGQYSAQFGANTGGSDTSLYRLGVGVLGVGTGGQSGAGWLQNTGGRARNTADVTNATATLANLADLSLALVAGRKYTGVLRLPVNESTAADGAKFDLNGGTATFTSIAFGVAAALGATVGVRTSTAAGTAVTLTALGDTSDVWVEIPVTLVCNAAGTVIPRQAQNAHSTGTLTVRAGGYFWLEDSPN